MAKVLVLYYSMYGHIETMAHAVAEGANKVDGVEVVVKRVPETMQAEAFAKAGGKPRMRRSPRLRNWRITTPLSSAPHPFWQYVRPDAHLPRSDGRAVGLWRAVRQTRQRVQLHRDRRRREQTITSTGLPLLIMGW